MRRGDRDASRHRDRRSAARSSSARAARTRVALETRRSKPSSRSPGTMPSSASSHSDPRSARSRPRESRAKETTWPLGSSRRGVLRSPQSTRGPGRALASPPRIASSVRTLTQPLAAFGTWTQWISTGPVAAGGPAAAIAVSGQGTGSAEASASGAREARSTPVRRRAAGARELPGRLREVRT